MHEPLRIDIPRELDKMLTKKIINASFRDPNKEIEEMKVNDETTWG